MEPLLLVEDKPELRAMLKKALERAGHTVDEAPDGSSAVAKVRARRYVLVLTDLKLPGCSGIEVLRETKQADPTIPVILITAYGSVEEAVTAMKEGAYDFIQKPVDLEHLNLLVERASQQQELMRENLLLREEYAERYGFPRIVGEHKSMQEATHQVQRVAATDSTVLLLGQSGTGKELFARAVHHLSPRRQHPFVALNCAAIPEGLVENELFGHERGAYTGAGSRKVGKMELANRGTIFLDEIAEMSTHLQAKLLHVLQDGQFSRLGARATVNVDVRVLAATNMDVKDAMRSGRFREDLYYRLNVLSIHVPPLRERTTEIPLLFRHFLAKYSEKYAKPAPDPSKHLLEAALRYPWPGNLRELENFVKRYVILEDDEGSFRELLEMTGQQQRTAPREDAAPPKEQGLKALVRGLKDEAEMEAIADALEKTNWCRKDAAKMLGISYKALLYKMRQFNLDSGRGARSAAARAARELAAKEAAAKEGAAKEAAPAIRGS